MSEPTAADTVDTAPPSAAESVLGPRVRALRAQRGWTLERAAQATGLGRSTLSKIENGQMSPTYDALIKLAQGLGIDVGALFEPPVPEHGSGRRSLTRAGTGPAHLTPHYQHQLLCNELSRKDMTPFRTRITARRYEDFDDWSRHAGEEFIYVLSGEVGLSTEFYEPVHLGVGDCAYLDSRMGHRVISLSPQDAELLWVSTNHPKTAQGLTDH